MVTIADSKEVFGRYPSIIKNNKFLKNGLVKIKNELYVPAYCASQLGFNYPGKFFLKKEFYPELRKRKILPLCPFDACEEFLKFHDESENISMFEYEKMCDENCKTIGIVNYKTLIPHSKMLIAILDGSHAVDDGVAAEIGDYSHYYPMIGIRSDFRLAEHIRAPINMAVMDFFNREEFPDNKLYSGMNAYDEAYDGIEKLAKKIIKETE
ncbi:hypothetical protein ACFL1H_06490 [Nanoarchaeota archaeon]